MQAFITGIGWVSKKSMGHKGCVQHFDPKASLPLIKRKDVLSSPYKLFGRMDAFSKLGFAAIAFALKDAGITKDPENIQVQKKDVSMVVSTVTGCLETDVNFQDTMSRKLPSPAVFAYTLSSSFLGEAAIYFGLAGESFVINEEKTTGLNGLFMALEIIDSGPCDTVLYGVCNSEIKPADHDSDSIMPGSLFFVLQKQCDQSYGMIHASSLERFYYQNNIKITRLYDLAQKCTNLGKKEHHKDL